MRITFKRFVVAALVAIVGSFTTIGLSSAQTEPTPTTSTTTTITASSVQKPKCVKPWQHNRYVRYVLRYSDHGGNYRAVTPTKRQVRKAATMRACAKKYNHVGYVKMRHYWVRRRTTWAFYQHIDDITPYGKWAIDPYIVNRESTFNRCAANPSSTAGGYYQMIDSTWFSALRAIGYHGQTKFGRYPGDRHVAACAPDWLQHEAAAYLWAGGKGRYIHWQETA